MYFFSLSILISCFTSAIAIESKLTPIVNTENGPVRGLVLKTVRKSLEYSSFRGIPYAEPPIQNNRYKPPIRKTNWTNVFNATAEGNVCLQPYGGGLIVGSEDCLILNIFTPQLTFTNLRKNDSRAVMVWIYGGGFTGGASISSMYGPDYLLEDDVIVVSLNYRLGALGFLNLNNDHAPGNAGLKDQNLALQWIKKNIEKFGGDPERITIFGQSAGGVSVDLHVLSEMSTGLFTNSISMSGSPLCLYWGLQTNREAHSQAYALATKLGIDTSDIDKLSKGLIAASASDVVTKSSELNVMAFRPTIERSYDGRKQPKFLSECSVNKYLSGNYNKGPHMAGFTSNEGKSFFSGPAELMIFAIVALKSLQEAKISLDVPHFREFIASGGDVTNITEETMNEMIKVGSGLFFDTGIDYKQKLLNINNSHPTYYYRFSFETASEYRFLKSEFDSYNISGVGHGGDIPYLFYMSSGLPIEKPEIRNMIDRYVRLMTNFAKYSDPTPYGKQDPLLKIEWPESGRLGLHLEISENLTVQPRPINEDVEINEIAGIGNSIILNDCVDLSDECIRTI